MGRAVKSSCASGERRDGEEVCERWRVQKGGKLEETTSLLNQGWGARTPCVQSHAGSGAAQRNDPNCTLQRSATNNGRLVRHTLGPSTIEAASGPSACNQCAAYCCYAVEKPRDHGAHNSRHVSQHGSQTRGVELTPTAPPLHHSPLSSSLTFDKPPAATERTVLTGNASPHQDTA